MDIDSQLVWTLRDELVVLRIGGTIDRGDLLSALVTRKLEADSELKAKRQVLWEREQQIVAVLRGMFTSVAPKGYSKS